MSAAKIRAPHAFNASRSFVISVFIHEHSLSTRVLGVKSGEQGDKSVSLMRVKVSAETLPRSVFSELGK